MRICAKQKPRNQRGETTKKRERRDERPRSSSPPRSPMGAVSSSLLRRGAGAAVRAPPISLASRPEAAAPPAPVLSGAAHLVFEASLACPWNWDPKAPGALSDGNFVLNLDGAAVMRRRLQFGLFVAMNELADGEGAAVRRLQICTRAEIADWIPFVRQAWEGRAYDYGMDNLKSMGFPVDDLKFDPDLVIRGLIIDKEKGNLVKADRFGYVKRAMHGTQMLSTRAVSEIYGRELVDLRKESRWEFLNTLFSVSEAVMFMQMVDKLDQGLVPAELGPLDYKGLYNAVSKALFRAHVEGQLKREIMAEPERFVEPDPELPLALLDQKEAGKKFLLITNSDFHYTNKMMNHAFNRFLPNDVGWRDLFEMVIVSARKPEFFQLSHPLYEVVTDDGLMRPCFKVKSGGLYSGGSAQMVEKSLDIHGDEILYVGDHIYTDVSQSKVHLRWRTALICRELEDEFDALVKSHDQKEKLVTLIQQKENVGDLFNQLRLALQRRSNSRPAQTLAATCMDEQELTESMQKLLIVMQRLDEKIGPMLEADGELFNKRWGWLSCAGLWDKSHLTRQIEKYADIYTSRVSNFLHYTPFMYFQSQEQTLRKQGWKLRF
ncbi:5'-nucleotidase domain-containing protein 4 isoform X2 [Sorghum bicolor]|uniref:5'-nucleotidase domain-containing protein 4 isoform X2 n=1 Tax=Sorghum bicolor TaxID=4558 RepID=UPI00081ADFD0|nr:5'-nucleotidase domain-containing protein 4 isoform X2 [Sorghum bicolor]|eukprot:XP_021313634.1 5'-nucleotidase domain-containing protein 4 isoform X2 [Sorghum bicolor]